MTRKHFQALADTLGRGYAAGVLADKRAEVTGGEAFFSILEEVERFCRSENPHFDRGRFRKAVTAAIRDEMGADWRPSLEVEEIGA